MCGHVATPPFNRYHSGDVLSDPVSKGPVFLLGLQETYENVFSSNADFVIQTFRERFVECFLKYRISELTILNETFPAERGKTIQDFLKRDTE